MGMTSKEISTVLHIGAKSVEAHRYRMMRTLGVGSTFDLCIAALSQGTVTVDDFPIVSTVAPNSLTALQFDILIGFASGESTENISKRLRLSRRMIEAQKFRMMMRLNIPSRIQLMHYAFQQGLIALDGSGGIVLCAFDQCSDCKGSGSYVGLNSVEPCAKCDGKGRIRRAA